MERDIGLALEKAPPTTGWRQGQGGQDCRQAERSEVGYRLRGRKPGPTQDGVEGDEFESGVSWVKLARMRIH